MEKKYIVLSQSSCRIFNKIYVVFWLQIKHDLLLADTIFNKEAQRNAGLLCNSNENDHHLICS